jgi:ABC-type nitrate/sulfonate/bicarbonate transport system substrate-binding protein
MSQQDSLKYDLHTRPFLKQKKVWVFASILILCLFLGIYFFWYDTASKEQMVNQYVGPTEKVTIGNIGEYSLFNLIAKDKGYFKDYGLDVEIKEYESGPAAVADLLAGKLDIAVAADFVGVRNIFTNQRLRIVTQASKHKVFQVVARKDKGISQPSDLKGKKVGVTRKGAGEFYLGRYLTFNNLYFNDVKIIDLPPSEIITQLYKGQIDAAVIFDPHAYAIQKNLGSNGITWSAQGNEKVFALIYSTDTFIESHPAIITRYLQATLQAEQYIKEHPEETKNFIIKTLNYDAAYVDYMLQNFDFINGLDQELLLTMENQARWVIGNKLTDQTKVPNYLDYIYFEGLQEVKPEAITIIR